MTSKERVLAAINHEQPDRVPIQTYLTPEIHKVLVDHFGTNDILPILGVDFRGVGPRFVGEPKPIPEGCQFVDEWGTGYKTIQFETGAYEEASYLPLAELETLDDVEAYPWPTADQFDFSGIEAQCDALKDFAICCSGAGTPDIVNGVSRGRGMERVMMDIMIEDPVGVAIIDKRCDTLYERCRCTLEAGNGKIDILCTGEDCGCQAGPMFPLEVFDRFFRPRLKRFYDLAHEFGAKAMMHSCGNTRKLMPRFIEMGLDVLDAMQPEPPGMVPEEIKAEFGDKLAFCGLISTQQTLPFGTEADCRAEARHRLEVMTPNGGYIFSPAHCIQSDTPLRNVLAIYEEALGLAPETLLNYRKTP
ncbi:MAG TPA: uroporphyrinogen decarboxylase family protein [Candidatus Hydrogenedentes bacterium]|nr:uroporphyrinogen decarboxylase family protein [Candidatus Hydrogenedentota bacterium]HPG65846.1 uroporphyrinogen decarboxylase family protein [Candidatus Hydrogenedentota bacterium]